MRGVLGQQCAEPLRCDEHRTLLVADKADDHKRAERRVETKPAEGDFLPVEALVILGCGQLQNLGGPYAGLDQRPGPAVRLGRRARRLSNQAEHALIRAEALTEQQ